MLIWISAVLALLAVPLCIILDRFFRKKDCAIPWFMWYLLFVLPFGAGGFHTFLTPVTAAVLTGALYQTGKKRKELRLVWNGNAAALGLLVLGYCITLFWAADKGMAFFGLARYLPLLMLTLLLMQYDREEKAGFLACLPACGVAVTVVCFGIFQIPAVKSAVTVIGRFSGSFQYPNTYAAFLLVCLGVLGTKQKLTWLDIPAAAVLLAGLYLSGSRIGLMMLAVVLPGIAVARGKLPRVVLWILLGVGGAAGILLLLSGGEGKLLGRSLASMYSRLLFYKDALPVIWKHPFGLGYYGYRVLLPTFQTGRYAASYVHNVLMQLMLDVGWIPALVFAFRMGMTLLSPKVRPQSKLLLGTILLYGLLDFHFQFFFFWVVLLLCLDLDTGKKISFPNSRRLCAMLCAPVLVLCCWLGTGDLLYRAGNYAGVLKVTPFHTESMTEQLKTLSDAEELEALADRILKQCPTVSLAYSAKANAAMARGDALGMIRNKEQAIACAPYTQAEYCDYIDKLYAFLSRYVQLGDQTSAAYCLDRILQVPRMMEMVSAKTDPMAHIAISDTTLTLPQAYQDLILALQEANPG